MIDRLNFYDLYGYAVPGLLLLVLLWVPYGLAAQELPDADFASALFAIVLAYVVGHVLQILARPVFPSKVLKPRADELRYPSDLFLDGDDATFSGPVKEQLVERIRRRFGIDVGDSAYEDRSGQRQEARDNAFRLCRAALLTGKVGSYAEQFQGMYALMRGLAAAFLLSAAFQFGWVFTSIAHHVSGSRRAASILSVVVLVAGLLVYLLLSHRRGWPAARRNPEAWWFWSTGFLLFVAGTLVVHGAPSHDRLRIALLQFILAVLLLMLAYLCHRSHVEFARLFAREVYSSFLVMNHREPDEDR